MFKFSSLFSNHQGPVQVEPSSPGQSLIDAIVPRAKEFRQKLLEHGAILFRGFQMPDVQEFDRFIKGVTDQSMEYVYRSTPRSVVTERVSTATNYPPQLEIPLHNENAYQRNWPLAIAFCCTQPAAEGGQTPIAPMRQVTAQIGGQMLDKLEELGVSYVRHYHPGVDLPWQDVFQTSSTTAVEQYCRDHDIEFEWLGKDLLRTINAAQGTAVHPITGERIFFNQAHLFHVSSLGKMQAEALVELFGIDRLPRHSRFGNGEEISDEELQRINAAFKAHTLEFSWQIGDVLWLDNMQYAHGRRSFKGVRKVFASLMEPYSVEKAVEHA